MKCYHCCNTQHYFTSDEELESIEYAKTTCYVTEYYPNQNRGKERSELNPIREHYEETVVLASQTTEEYSDRIQTKVL